MGEGHSTRFSFDFNGSIRVETRGESLSADAGVLLLRELDAKFGLTERLAEELIDPRNPEMVTHALPELLRSRIYALAQGYTDQNDLDDLRDDPVFRIATSERRGVGPLESPRKPRMPDGLASQPTHSRLVQMLATDVNLEVLQTAVFDWAARIHRATAPALPVILDVDSFPIRVHGYQAGSAYSGHYKMCCYHPIVTMLGGTGEIVAAELRPGNVYTSRGAADHLLPVIDRARTELGGVKAVRGDAGFPEERLLSSLEGEDVRYVFRLGRNKVLNRLAAPYLRRPPGRPPREPRMWLHDLSYAAKKWSRPRRVVLVVIERPDELFFDFFFLVTSFTEKEMSGEEILFFYRERGTMERHLGELKSVLSPTLSSTTREKSHVRGNPPETRAESRDPERANAANLCLFLLAYNLMSALRHVVPALEPDRERMSLSRIRARILKIATRVTKSARYVTYVINAARRALWERVHSLIRNLEVRPGET